MRELGERQAWKPNQRLTRVFLIFGWGAFAAAFAQDLRMIYEQTRLTWTSGPQMLGFSISHLHPEILVIGALGLLGCNAWLAGFLFIAIWRRVKSNDLRFPVPTWLQALAVSLAVVIPWVPYSAWQIATIESAGLGHYPAEQLRIAAADNEIHLVNLLLKDGVPVDAPSRDGATALNAACVCRQLDMARQLIAKGGNLDKAPACRNFAEFRSKMEPVVPAVEPNFGLPSVPGATVYVDGSKPSSDSDRPQAR